MAKVAVRRGTASVIVLPDTQNLMFGSSFTNKTDWIVDNAAALNLAAVVHVGDLVDSWNQPVQWQRAAAGIALLDVSEIPFLFACGAWHDEHARDTTEFNAILPQSLYTAHSWWNGAFFEANHSENAWITVKIAGEDWLLIILESGPRAAVMAWAVAACAAHPAHRVGLFTHGYLGNDGLRITPADSLSMHNGGFGFTPDCHDGSEMWDEYLKDVPNLRWVQNGHISYALQQAEEAHAVSTGTHGNSVVEVLANYQVYTGGYHLRVVTLRPSDHYMRQQTCRVADHYRTEAPAPPTWKTDPQSDWEVNYE